MQYLVPTAVFSAILASGTVFGTDAAEFLEEAPKAWAEAFALRKQLSCVTKGTIIRLPGQKDVPKDFQVDVLRIKDRVLIDSFDGSKHIIYCNSDDYCFHIGEVPGATGFVLNKLGKPWPTHDRESAIKLIDAIQAARRDSVSPDTEESAIYQDAVLFLNESELGVAAINRVVPFTAIPWDDPNSVKILKCQSQLDGDSELTTIEAEIELKGDMLPGINGQVVTNIPTEKMTCVFVFDSSQWWLPIRGTTTYPGIGVESWEATYEQEFETLPLLTELKRTSRPTRAEGYEFVKKFEYPTTEPDADRFTLSHYGLPEPDNPGRRRKWILLIAIIGLLLIGIAYRFYRSGNYAST